jgi:anti-sigma regulatory factor (Ser/Thr protein kinase)
MMRAFAISGRDQIPQLRREGEVLSAGLGFSQGDAGRVAIILTELGTNLSKHAPGGEILIGSSPTTDAPCIEILALDRGPGMADIEQCLTDGFSTAGSQGTGLGAVKRQATGFDVYSVPGHGTAIHARVCRERTAYRSRESIAWAAIERPLSGEEVCGDTVAIRETGNRFVALVADGLGHGTFAADASRLAADIFRQSVSLEAEALVEAMHAALRASRGAALAVTELDLIERRSTFCGIGNIAGTLSFGGSHKKMTSMNGTAGHVARRVQGFQYPYGPDALLVMHSDGISGSWNLDKYPGLLDREPMLIAAVLYRDFGRARDDASILVTRVAA